MDEDKIDRKIDGLREEIKKSLKTLAEVISLGQTERRMLTVDEGDPLYGQIKKREQRILADSLASMDNPRLQDECKICWGKNIISKGEVIKVFEFKKSRGYLCKCPICDHEWGMQLKK